MTRITIVPYRAEWPAEFAVLGEALRRALGNHALAIHHIGSTSVPGLAAKDVIDVQVGVANLDDPHLRDGIELAGLIWRPQLFADHLPPGLELDPAELAKRAASTAPGQRSANVHLRVAGRFNHRYALLCRDYLRSAPLAAAAYGEIKRNLAAHFPDDVDAYYSVKDPVFDVIMAGAEAWAAAMAWEIPPTDA